MSDHIVLRAGPPDPEALKQLDDAGFVYRLDGNTIIFQLTDGGEFGKSDVTTWELCVHKGECPDRDPERVAPPSFFHRFTASFLRKG